MSLPTDSAERKRIPIFTGLLVYFPDALASVAAHSFISNEKHNPGEPCHWSREKSNDHLDCIARHLTDIAARPEDLDLRVFELKAVVWRALAQLQLDIEAQQTRDAAERAGVTLPLYGTATATVAKKFTPGNTDDPTVFTPSVPGPRHAYTPGSFDVVSTPAHNVGESGACICPQCIRMAEGWITWEGGIRPVPISVEIEVELRSGRRMKAGFPEFLRWRHDNTEADIVAYRRL